MQEMVSALINLLSRQTEKENGRGRCGKFPEDVMAYIRRKKGIPEPRMAGSRR